MRLDERSVVADIKSKLKSLGYNVVQQTKDLPVDIMAAGSDRLVLVEVTTAPRVAVPQVMALASGSDFARSYEDKMVHPVLVYMGEMDNQAREFARKSGVTAVRLQETINPVRLILTSREAYSKILAWHKKNSGKIGDRGSEDCRVRYLEYLESAPPPEEASQTDMIRMADEVLMGLFEWAYVQEDEAGVPLNQYARIIKDELGERPT
jgi:hypothetical protein